MPTMIAENINKRFPKEERLCSLKSIDRLFSSGASFISYPLRIVFFAENEPDESKRVSKILVSVSKRKFKQAVKRNRVKRMIKEAYRLNKYRYSEIPLQHESQIEIAFLYLKDELPDYAEIEKAIVKAATILSEKLKGKEGDVK